MHEIPGTRSKHAKRPGRLRTANRWFWENIVGEMLGELVIAILACLLFAGVVIAAAWGYERAPKSTVALGIALVALAGYGFLALTGRTRDPRSGLAVIATSFCIFVGVWLTYVLQYCTCL